MIRKTITNVASSLGWVVISFGCNLAIIAWLFSRFEDRSIGDSMWWATVTATTTGYGDISPATFIGRLLGAELMLSSVIFFLPMIVVHLYDRYVRNKNQFSHAEQEWIMRALQILAAERRVPLPPPPSDTEHGDVK